MIRNLRKGCSSAYFQHAHTSHSIGAQNFECEIRSGMLIVRFTLRPVDRNQRDDAEYFHEHPLISVEFDDSHIIKNLRSFLTHHSQECSAWQLEIFSNGKRFLFPVTPRSISQDHLRLIVEEAAS